MNPRLQQTIIFLLGGLLILFGTAMAMDHAGHGDKATGQNGHGGHDMGGKGSQGMDHEKSHPQGQMIAEQKVQEYTLAYHLLNLTERNAMMKGMEGMKMHGMSNSPDITHHLMVYIQGPDGKPVSGKVGFMITGPDGKPAKTLTMGMYNGYGADVSFKTPGVYKIKTKAVIKGKGKTLEDEFEYPVKENS